MENQQYDTERYQDLVTTFKALANEDRLKMIDLLKDNKEMSAQEVERHFYLEQSTTSHHLNTLKRSKITKSRKQGRHIYYSIDTKNASKHLEYFLKEFLG